MRGPGSNRRLPLVVVRAAKLLMIPFFAVGISGCGFLFVDGPPSGYEKMNYFSCTESKTGPILDAIWAGLNAVGTVAVAADPEEYDSDTGVSSGAGIAVGLGWTALSGTSAFVGFNKVSDCRRAKHELADRQQTEGRSQEQDTTSNILEKRLYEAMRR